MNKEIPYILLDKDFNIVKTSENINAKKFNQTFFENILNGFTSEDFDAPVNIDATLMGITDSSLIFNKKDENIICYIVKRKNTKTNIRQNISYRIREPVSGIFSVLPVIADNINKSNTERAISNLESVNQQSYSLLRRINNISLTSKILNNSLPSVSSIDFSLLLENIVTSVKTIEKNVVIESDIEKNIYINANHVMITNAVLNLISNSINFKTDENVKISIKLNKNKGNAVFSYSDNSKGIKEEHMPYIFNPYYSKDPYGEDNLDPYLGVGLFIAKTAFEQAEGKILLTSVFGEGISYTISIPMEKDDNDIFESSVSDFLMNRYSDIFIQLSDSCILPSL